MNKVNGTTGTKIAAKVRSSGTDPFCHMVATDKCGCNGPASALCPVMFKIPFTDMLCLSSGQIL